LKIVYVIYPAFRIGAPLVVWGFGETANSPLGSFCNKGQKIS